MNTISSRWGGFARLVRLACMPISVASIGWAFVLGTAAQAQLSAPGPRVVDGFGDLVHCDGLESGLACAGAPLPGVGHPVKLEQISPLPSNPGTGTSIQFRAGWPLIFRASVDGNDMLGIGRVFAEQGFELFHWAFAEVGQGGAIVFDDPDGNWSYAIPSDFPRDELLLDFYPDSGDVSGVVDDAANAPGSHDSVSRLFLRPEFGGPLPLHDVNGGQGQTVLPDGVQFGADDDFPGLVILSNVGVGIVLQRLADGWNPLLPRQGRNLAGLMTSVGYELSDALGQTSITAMMVVPRFLFAHIRLRDPCVGIVNRDGEGLPVSCSGPPVQRVDGGPVTAIAPGDFNDESIVQLRAFVVAPVWNSVSNQLEGLDTVVDMNADGLVSALDARLMGRHVLSNEVLFSFRQIGSATGSGRTSEYSPLVHCNGAARPDSQRLAGYDYEYDLDGNGYSILNDLVVCPGGGSGITRPPR